MEVSRYEVRDSNNEVIGYLERQGEDGRFTDEEGDLIKSFLPWKKALSWAKEQGHTVHQLSSQEPVVVLGE